MRSVELVEVLASDPVYRKHAIEGTVPYYVRFKAEDGFEYVQQVWAKDHLDAALQVLTGNYSELNRRMMEIPEE